MTTTLVESGEAFRRLGGLEGGAKRERFDVIVIGGGQAGLSVGYHLRNKGLRFAILDASERVGDVWRRRWDSLRLFTPAKLDGLDGMRFPAPPDTFPTKDQMADYLEAYAARFELPVRTGTRVERLSKRGGAYVVKTNAGELEADQVVIAMSSYQHGKLPAFAGQVRPDVVQLHSTDYRNPAQLRAGGVLLVGAGNSGAEIAMELARREEGRSIWVAGPSTGEVPFRVEGFAGRKLLARLVLRVLFHRVLTIRTPMGRKVRPQFMTRGAPLLRVKDKALAAVGVERVARVASIRDGLPVLADGRVLDVANIIWCTGFHAPFPWIDLPGVSVIGDRGEPIHEGGVATDAPGLYFVGLHFLYSVSSGMIHGVGRDAARIVKAVAARAVSSARARDQDLQALPAG
jgi:putative flavoprotein involved in K+ transport